MILLLDTSTPLCQLTLVGDEDKYDSEWTADRELAHGLLGYVESELLKHDKNFTDLTGIAAMKGPGSFTGLRIGLTVLNTLADSLVIPIVGETGDDWQPRALQRLESGENERIILPLYGSDANITAPRK